MLEGDERALGRVELHGQRDELEEHDRGEEHEPDRDEAGDAEEQADEDGRDPRDWPIVAAGTSVWRIRIGPLVAARPGSRPASWAATPSAATVAAWPTSALRFSVLDRGS